MGLSALNLYNVSGTIDLSKKQLDFYFPPFVTHSVLLVMSYTSAVKLILMEYLTIIDFKWLTYCSNLIIDNTGYLETMHKDVFSNTNFVINSIAVLLSLINAIDHKRKDSMLVFLLWNINTIWPQADGLVNSLMGDFLRIFIAVLTCIATIITNKSSQEAATKVNSADSSFHRIYSDCDEDLSEHSDEELSTSYESSFTPRNRKYQRSIINNSFSSIKSLSPSELTNGTLRNRWTNSASILNHSFRNESQPSSYTHYSPPKENLFLQQRANDQSYFFPNKFDAAKKCTSMSSLNPSYRIADDCQTKLTGLNISGINYANNRTITCSSPTPSIISVNRQRSHLLTPSRLNFNQDFNNHSSIATPVTQTSWVAGGFFVKNSMSPQKRPQPQTDDLHPILSRTSSQSSGFESHTSSLHNIYGNGSRGSSIAGDADYVSIFSEPKNFSDSVSQVGHRKNTTPSFTFGSTTLQKPKAIFPDLNNTQPTFIGPISCPTDSLTNYSTFPWTNCRDSSTPRPVYHQFGTHRGTIGGSYSGSMDSLNLFNKSSFHRSPVIRKGSLLKTLYDNRSTGDKF
jgi:hypothetical protein